LRQRGKLYNGDGEMIAEGFCELDEEGSQVTMWPALEKGLFERERGVLMLELEGAAATLRISERRLRLRINPTHGPRTFIYRMRIEQLPAGEAGPAAEEGEAVPEHLRRAEQPTGLPDTGAGSAPGGGPLGGLSTAP
jgi:hypothetical protein